MRIPICTVDAFTSDPFKGNPAAVCILEEDRDSDWMLSVAREMNLSETAFVCFSLRIAPHRGTDGWLRTCVTDRSGKAGRKDRRRRCTPRNACVEPRTQLNRKWLPFT